MNMTKNNVKQALGMRTDGELARYLSVLRQAVHQWPDDAPIPEGRQWQLRALRPDLFPVPAEAGSEARAA